MIPSAPVVDPGEYQGARVYGDVAAVDMWGKINGHTSMMLRFDRLVLPDGHRAPVHAEIVEPYRVPSGGKVDVEGRIQSGGRGRRSIEHTVSEREPALCSVGSSVVAKAPVSVL